MTILECKNIKKLYKTKNVTTEALKGVNFSVEKGEFISIMGESGAGKTTLLNIIATLDKATSGTLMLNGNDIGTLKTSDISIFRRKELGFVFQDFNLLDQFNNRENIYLPLVLSDEKPDLMKERLDEIQDRLGISEILEKYPYEISGGQKQRVAIARALSNRPPLILADEPTGNLDSQASVEIMELFAQLNAQGNTVIVVTHEDNIAQYAHRILTFNDGVMISDEINQNPTPITEGGGIHRVS